MVGSLSLGLVPLSAEFANYTFYYIAAAHGIQYLWVTLYFHHKTHPGAIMSFFYATCHRPSRRGR